MHKSSDQFATTCGCTAVYNKLLQSSLEHSIVALWFHMGKHLHVWHALKNEPPLEFLHLKKVPTASDLRDALTDVYLRWRL
jgi:hypothetical protein